MHQVSRQASSAEFFRGCSRRCGWEMKFVFALKLSLTLRLFLWNSVATILKNLTTENTKLQSKATELFSFKLRRPLLQKRLGSFVLIFRCARRAKQYGFQIQPLSQRHFHAFIHRF